MQLPKALFSLAAFTSAASAGAIMDPNPNVSLQQRQAPIPQPACCPVTCRDWNPRDEEGYEDYTTECGSEGTSTWLYCSNGRLCVNLEGHGSSEDDFKYWAEKDKCFCPEDCTTDGDGRCLYGD